MARLRILGVRVERHAGRVAVAVSLGYDGEVVMGQVDRAAVEGDAPRLAAEATLEALRQIAPLRTLWALEYAVVGAVSASRAVIVEVKMEAGGRAEHLVGSALSPAAPLEEAAARAVVDAVDRRLSWLIRT